MKNLLTEAVLDLVDQSRAREKYVTDRDLHVRLHCVLLPGLLLHPPDPDPLPLLQDLPHAEADDGQEEKEGEA